MARRAKPGSYSPDHAWGSPGPARCAVPERLRKLWRRVDRAVGRDHDPLTLVPLHAFDAAQARKNAAGGNVEQAAIAVLKQRAAGACLAHDPVLQHLVGRLE